MFLWKACQSKKRRFAHNYQTWLKQHQPNTPAPCIRWLDDGTSIHFEAERTLIVMPDGSRVQGPPIPEAQKVWHRVHDERLLEMLDQAQYWVHGVLHEVAERVLGLPPYEYSFTWGIWEGAPMPAFLEDVSRLEPKPRFVQESTQDNNTTPQEELPPIKSAAKLF